MSFDWNDLKAFLAVARGGSTLAAAKTLRVNQTTVARRIEALESALGLRLFERGQSGSRLTEAGRDLRAEAEKVERAAEGFASRAGAHGRGLAGSIRVTCSEVIANSTLTPAIAQFRRWRPDIQVELMISDEALDVAAGEADVALRAGRGLETSDLIARKLGEFDFALYCSRDYAARMGVPATPAELADHELISGAGPNNSPLPGMTWMFEQAGGRVAAHASNSMTNLLHAVRAGLGIAPLARILADGLTDLVCCSDDIADARVGSWLVTRRELKDVPRVRAFIDFLAPHIQSEIRQREAHNRAIREQAAANDEAAPGAVDTAAG